MLGEMKVEIMTQVDAAIKIQVSSVLEEMKFQMKVMFTKMVKEMISLRRENPSSFTNEEQNSNDISYEEEQDDEDMESLSSEEDIDLYTDQETTPGRSSLITYKKNNHSKRQNTSARRSKRAK